MNDITYEVDKNYDDIYQVNGNKFIKPVTVTVIVTKGTHPNEISWEITKDGDVIKSGEADEEIEISLEPGKYIFKAYDSYGDGWGGATFTITTCDKMILSGTLETGSSGDFPFTICC